MSIKTTVKKLPKSQVSIEVSVPADIFSAYKEKALKHVAEHIEVPGFRKGKAPANIIEKEVKPMALLEEMADMVINEHLPKILTDEKVDAIGRPMIAVTKIAEGNDFEFTVTLAVIPDMKLPDYKKIAKEENAKEAEVKVTDEELDGAIKELKKARAHNEIHQSGAEHNHEEFEKQEFDATLTDEYIKQLGDFKDVAEFKEKFRENIKNEKSGREAQKRRVTIIENIIAGTEVELPDVLVENELENLMARLKNDIEMSGLQFDQYLTHIKKSEGDIRNDMRVDAEKRAKSELILIEIAKAEKIEPNKEEVDEESKRLIQTYQDVDPLRVRAYVVNMLLNDAVFKFLDAQK